MHSSLSHLNIRKAGRGQKVDLVIKFCMALREGSDNVCDNVFVEKSHLVGFGFHGDDSINRNHQNHHSHSSQH